MGAYEIIVNFLEGEWREFEKVLINPPSFSASVENLVRTTEAVRRSAENPNQIRAERDIYGMLAARQMDFYAKLCYRDGFAPIISTIVYTIEKDIYDILLSTGETKKERKERQEEILQTATFLAYEFNWTIYLHTLVTLQRIKRAVNKYSAALGATRWGKEIDKLISIFLSNIAAVLPYQISLQWLIEGLCPTRLDAGSYAEIHKLLREIWSGLSSIAKVGFLPPAPVPEGEVLKFYGDFTEGTLRIVQERLSQNYHLPVIAEPLKVVVVYGEEARYTQSVAFFRETYDGKMEIYIFKPPQAPFNPAQEIHLLFHEGIPGHAYVAHQHRQAGAPLPVDEAIRLTDLSGFAYIDTFSVFHEGWAVFAQRLGAELSDNDELKRYFFVELLSYLERFMVLENIIPLYTVKPHIPRFAEPFQFASYFIGYLLWELCAEKEGMQNLWRRASSGLYPHYPTPKELVELLKKLLNSVIALREKEKAEKEEKKPLRKGEMPVWVCYTR